jgi:hypothetical protein
MTKINVGDTVCYTYVNQCNDVVRGVGTVISDQPLIGTDYAFAIQLEGTEGYDYTVHVRQDHCLLLETRGQRLERILAQAIAEEKAEYAKRLEQAIETNRKTFSAKLRTGFYHSALAQ